jgi:CRISPR-associated protein Csc2
MKSKPQINLTSRGDAMSISGIKSLELHEKYFAPSIPKTPQARYVTILLLRETKSYVIFTTEPEQLDVERTRAGLINKEPIDRIVMFKHKQVAPERRTGKALLRQYVFPYAIDSGGNFIFGKEAIEERKGVLSEEEKKGFQEFEGCYLMAGMCSHCVDCLVYGFAAIEAEGARKSRVLTDTCFTVRPYAAIQKHIKFNAIDEATQESQTITEYDYVLPEVFLPSLVTTMDLTIDEFVYVLSNVLRTTRYGKEATRQGFLRNHVVGLAFSDAELFSNLEFTQALYDSFCTGEKNLEEDLITLEDFSHSLPQVLATLLIFIFDEFHLYNPKQIGNIAFFLGTLNKITPKKGRVFIFASATPQEEFSELIKSLGIPAEPVLEENPETLGEGQIIAHKVSLSLIPCDLLSWSGIGALKENWTLIKDFLEKYPKGRIVSIVDSVAGSIQLAGTFRVAFPDLEVGEIHGFSSEEARRKALKAQVTVGTSTIEVGIDFKGEHEKDLLIFEARTSGQFIQRLGRIARHDKVLKIPNHAIALIPFYVYNVLAEKLKGKSTIERQELYNLVNEVYKDPEEFQGYLRKHAPIEMAKGSNLVTDLFMEMEGNQEKVKRSIDELISTLTGASLEQACYKYNEYERLSILRPLFTFRGAELSVAVIDERGVDTGFPFKTGNLMFFLRRGIIEEIQEEEFWKSLETVLLSQSEWETEGAIIKKRAKPIKRDADDLSGVFGFFRFKGLLDKARKVWFEIELSELSGKKGCITVISGLEIVTEPSLAFPHLSRLLRRKKLVGWFIDQAPGSLRFGRALPPLFEIFPLKPILPGGRAAEASWSIAFNQNAFFLDSLGWK